MSNKNKNLPIRKPAPTGSKSVAPVTNTTSTSTSASATKSYSGYGYGYGYASKPKSVFMKNYLLEAGHTGDLIDFYEDTIITKVPGGKYIEIYFSANKEFKFSADSINAGKSDNNVSKFLNENIYPSLREMIKEEFSDLPCHIYGILGRNGFFIYDIFVNQTFLYYEDLEEVTAKFQDKIQMPEKIYEGPYVNAIKFTKDRTTYLARPYYDDVDADEHFIVKVDKSRKKAS
jgi:hypothetical protein